MPYTSDMYSLLTSYAAQTGAPLIKETAFFTYLGTQAGKAPGVSLSERNREEKYRTEIEAAEAAKCCEVLRDKTGDAWVFLPDVCRSLLQQLYEDPESAARESFAGEEALGMAVPGLSFSGMTTLRRLDAESELVAFLDDPGDTNDLVRICFPKEFGSALACQEITPDRLVEAGLYKLQVYLRRRGNKEYVYQKLVIQFKGNESFLSATLNRLAEQPQDCIRALEDGDDLTFLFWGRICLLLREDIGAAKTRQKEDTGVFQAACVLDAANQVYKEQAVQRAKKNQAFKTLQARLNEPPYCYSQAEIAKFTDPEGHLLTNLYSADDLDQWLRKRITETVDDKLPELLVFRRTATEQVFIAKNRIFPVCGRLLTGTRDTLRDAITRKWRDLLAKYQEEPGMTKDADFERLLAQQVRLSNPLLASLLEDSRLVLLYRELGDSHEGAFRLFARGALIPYSALFFLKRRDLLDDARSALPVYYRIPVISGIIAFFMKRGQRKAAVSEVREGAAGGGGSAFRDLEAAIIPEGYTLDSYLEEQEKRWMRLSDVKGRDTLRKDLQGMAREKLRESIKVRKRRGFTAGELEELAVGMVEWTPSLKTMDGKDSLTKYLQVYFLKLLETTSPHA